MAKPTWVYLAGCARKVWRWSNERKEAKKAKKCAVCGKLFNTRRKPEIDHIKPIGRVPREFSGWDDYYKSLFCGALQALCHKCHQIKTQRERKEMKRGQSIS